MSDEPQITDDDLLAVHLNGFASGRDYERKQIVAWLRDQGGSGEPFKLDPMSSLGLPLDYAASLIEAGEHLK